jgi:hypothetical protein
MGSGFSLTPQCKNPCVLSAEPDRNVKVAECAECGRSYRRLTLFLHRDGDAHAVCHVALHDHDGREAWFDAIFGSWDEDDDSDRVTFGCRVGTVVGQTEPAATLVQAAIPFGDSPVWGRKLSRDEALVHPWLPDFWEAVDFVLLTDPDVRLHVYG